MKSRWLSAWRSLLEEERGLTLVEIIVVLIILAIVGAMLMGNVIGAGDKAKLKITQMKMTQLKGLIDQYQLMNNRLPTVIDDLSRCDEKAGPGCFPVAKEDDLKDAWDTKFTFSLEGGSRKYKLTSLGADKQPGGSSYDADLSDTGP